MPAPVYSSLLQASYQRLFDTCVIDTSKYILIDKVISGIEFSKIRYQTVGDALFIPWYFIGLVHYMECAGNFNKHLHNGDSLNARTINVPAGRPKKGLPPFSWEESATDALVYQKMDQWKYWSAPGILYKLEGYNGFGYRRLSKPINSPYLWSYSNHYTSGKYVKDGVYSSTAISKQIGAAVLLRRLAEKNIIQFGSNSNNSLNFIKALGADVKYAPSKYHAKAEELQKLLNQQGAHLRIDGKAGKLTSTAFFNLTRNYLAGHPKN